MKKRFLVVSTLVVLVLIVIGGAVAVVITHSSPAIPANIDKQLNFRPLWPASGTVAGFKLDQSSVKYDPTIQVLSFVMTAQGNRLVMSEQSYPDIVIYDKLVGTLNQYGEIDTKAGKVNLTRPAKLGGKQSAVTNADNLLVFVNADNDLTNDQWQQFFNSLEVIK